MGWLGRLGRHDLVGREQAVPGPAVLALADVKGVEVQACERPIIQRSTTVLRASMLIECRTAMEKGAAGGVGNRGLH